MKNRMRMLCIFLILFTMISNLEAHSWGNGSSSSIDYPYYGIHDAIADIAYQKLKNYNETIAQWITDFYFNSNGEKWGDYEYSFNKGSDNWLGYTDDPDSHFKDWRNHMYYVHPYEDHDERGAPDRIQQLYNWVVGNLTSWIKNGRPTRSEDEHKATYAAGLLTHYFSDISQFGHTDYTKQDHTYADSSTYHNNYESRRIGKAFLDQLLSDLNSYDFEVSITVTSPKDIAIQLATWVNSYDGTTVLYYDAPIGKDVIVGSTYAQMLTDYVKNYDSGLEYLGARGYTQQLYQQTLSHIKATVGNLTRILYTAYKAAESAQTKSTIDGIGSKVIYAPSNTVYFIFADPDRMTLPEASYDRLAGSIIYGLTTNKQNQGFDNNNAWVSQNEVDRGKLLLTNKCFLFFGGPYPHWSVKYYENAGLSPIYFYHDSTTHQWQFKDRSNIVIAYLPDDTDWNHTDMFVIESFMDEDGNTIFIFYGFTWKGTWASAIYFQDYMFGNIENYENSYYIFQWSDQNDDAPQANEIIQVATA
ncbi:MAG: hypothetical protein ACUVTD_06570 [Nitrososphaerales archaeon]